MLSRVALANSRVLSQAQPTVQRRNAASLKSLQLRMKAVAGVKKITQAMKMIAVSKLRSIQRLLPAARKFAQGPEKVWPVGEKPAGANKFLAVAVCSDRGFCGAVNSSISKSFKAMMNEMNAEQKSNTKFLFIGDKCRMQLERYYKNYYVYSFSEFTKKRPASFVTVSVIAEKLMALPFDEFLFVYNRFVSALAFETEKKTLYSLPVLQSNGSSNLYGWNFDGNKHEILKDLYEFRLASSLYGMMIENGTTEQSTRVNSMEGASKNSTEMLVTLRLVFNKARQAKITTELCEIIGGVVAQES